MRFRHLAAVLAVLTLGCSVKPPASDGPVTMAVVNARIWTGDARRPWADGIAVRGDRIAAVGSSAEIRKLARDVEVIDAEGQMIVPGLIDAHVHFIDGGFRLSSVQLRDARTPEAFIARIKAFAATVPAGTWITGGDWDHELWGHASHKGVDRLGHPRSPGLGQSAGWPHAAGQLGGARRGRHHPGVGRGRRRDDRA